MQTWTIYADDGEPADPLDDPQQRIRPAMLGGGANIAWLPEDGRVVEYETFGFHVKYTGGGFKTVAKLEADARLYVTERRVVLLVRDVDPGLGAVGGVTDLLTLGASGAVRDMGRSVTGRTGLREKFHLVGQIDYLSFILVRYYQTRIWGSRSLLDLGAFTGDPAPRAIEMLATSLPRKADIATLARGVHARARTAQLDPGAQDRTEQQLEAARNSHFRPSGDGQMATLGGSVITLTDLHGLGSPSLAPAPDSSPEASSGGERGTGA